MSVLLASMFINYDGGRYNNWAISITSDSGGHMAVAIPITGDMLVIIDPAGLFYTGIPGVFGVAKPISEAVNEWLDYWSPQLPGAYIDLVFNNKFYENFSSNTEFITWADGVVS
jgi:hypothetical protein